MKKPDKNNLLRIIALILLLAGAAGSLLLMFKAGRNQNSIVLIVLFTGWVLSPFAGLVISDVLSKRWVIKTRMTLYFLMIFIALASVIGYSGLLNIPGTKTAFKFLMVPLISWVLILIFVPFRRK